MSSCSGLDPPWLASSSRHLVHLLAKPSYHMDGSCLRGMPYYTITPIGLQSFSYSLEYVSEERSMINFVFAFRTAIRWHVACHAQCGLLNHLRPKASWSTQFYCAGWSGRVAGNVQRVSSRFIGRLFSGIGMLLSISMLDANLPQFLSLLKWDKTASQGIIYMPNKAQECSRLC